MKFIGDEEKNAAHGLAADMIKMANDINMRNITVIISFPLRGHQVVIQGQNPDFVVGAVEVMKKNAKLSQVEDNWAVSFPVNLTRPQVRSPE